MTSRKSTIGKPGNSNVGLVIGGGPSPESVNALRDAIVAILKSGAEQETLRCALGVLQKCVSVDVSNTTISNCYFTN